MKIKYYVAYKAQGFADFNDIDFTESFNDMKDASLKAANMCFDGDTSAVYAKIGDSFFRTDGDLCGEDFAWVVNWTVEDGMIVNRRAPLKDVIGNPEKFKILKEN